MNISSVLFTTPAMLPAFIFSLAPNGCEQITGRRFALVAALMAMVAMLKMLAMTLMLIAIVMMEVMHERTMMIFSHEYNDN